MEIFPAIDLKEGKAVRLFKGEISSAKIYSDAPWELKGLKIWAQSGFMSSILTGRLREKR